MAPYRQGGRLLLIRQQHLAGAPTKPLQEWLQRLQALRNTFLHQHLALWFTWP